MQENFFLEILRPETKEKYLTTRRVLILARFGITSKPLSTHRDLDHNDSIIMSPHHSLLGYLRTDTKIAWLIRH